MKLILISIFLFFFICCSQKTACGKLNYIDGITYLYNKKYSGKCESYFMGGKLRSIQEYKNGIDHNLWEFYYENGNVQTTGKFVMGKRVGNWKYFYENGTIWKINKYDSIGNRVGVWYEFDESGKKKDSTIFN